MPPCGFPCCTTGHRAGSPLRQQPAADTADWVAIEDNPVRAHDHLGAPERVDHRFNPAFRHLVVLVEKEVHVPSRSRCAKIADCGIAASIRRIDDTKRERPREPLGNCATPVRRTVVGDDNLVHSRR